MPQHRGKGVLKAIYETVKDMARQEGVSILRLYVDRSNTTAQKAYGKLKMSGTHCLMYETEA